MSSPRRSSALESPFAVTDPTADKTGPPAHERTGFGSLPHAESYRQLLESAPDAILVVDHGGRILFANRQTSAIFGYGAAELAGAPIELLIPERMRAAHRAHRDAYVDTPSQRPMGMGMTLIARARDGREFPVEVSLSPVALDGERVISAAVRDVSQIQRARDAVQRAHYNAKVAELAHAMIGTRELSDTAPLIARIAAEALGADVTMLYLLDAARKDIVRVATFGVPAEAPPQRHLSTGVHSGPAFIMAANDVVTAEDFAAETRFTMPPVVPGVDHHSGIGMAIAGDEGATGVLLACFRDARKFSEDDKNFLRSAVHIIGAALKTMRAEERLRHSQQLEAVGQLSGGIAHDFNNLLTVIIGNLQLIEGDVAGQSEVAQPVEAALRAANSAAELTRKLLAFSRRQALRPRPIDVNERVGSMLEMIRRTIGERIVILAHPDPAIPPALADPGQLETALLNLVVNARDAMPNGGRLTIETGVRLLDSQYRQGSEDVRPDRYVMLAVSDNGTGMPAQVLKRAFDPYFTTKERGKGSGLGLSMVHGFAKQSHGHVTIYSEPGNGTTVRLFLPIAPAGKPQESTEPRVIETAGHETILMVEDNREVQGVGARFLTDLGYRVFVADNAEQALTILDREPDIALLFTDIVLPGRRDGRELAAEARRRRPDLALLFTSGYANAAIDGLDDLPAALLDKPYRREVLAAAVRAALDRASAT
jgi:PAS domain S-box-containing protein